MTLAEDSERADELAEDVVTNWGKMVADGRVGEFSAEFKAMFEKCRRYRDAKRVADMHRGLGMLSELEAAEEKSAREAFLEAHKNLGRTYPKRKTKRGS
ncbi:MAG TPA: hypothetical protein VN861_14330 [Candidatus Acidoferrales bacterium]|nr:hypothetical protein [Candidatus Acidoferrales bacterium]